MNETREDTAAMTTDSDDEVRVALARVTAGAESVARREGADSTNARLLREVAAVISDDDAAAAGTRRTLLAVLGNGLRLWENYGRFEHALESCVVPCRHSIG